jgi:hypothetical protein
MDKSDLICENILSTIINVVDQEEATLRLADKGIFFIPELALAYIVGKEIYFNRKSVLLDENYKWIREQKLGPGIVDLMFDNGNDKIVIEFKILNKEGEFERDIIKLKKMPDNCLKLFCALEDVFERGKDEVTNRRIFRIKKRYEESLIKIGKDYSFPTSLKVMYKQDVVCFVELWRVM